MRSILGMWFKYAAITQISLWKYASVLLALPAERQRSFSLKSLISQKLSDNFFIFWRKIWSWLNHPKGNFKRSEMSN